tara:strand:- start:247 stop:975 length:729 start_codon:yes stop_codon:yes gene_type:complete
MAHIAALYNYPTGDPDFPYVIHSQRAAKMALEGERLLKEGEFNFEFEAPLTEMAEVENELLASLSLAGFEKTRGEIIKTARNIYAKIVSNSGIGIGFDGKEAKRPIRSFNEDDYKRAIDMAAGGNGNFDDNDNVGGLMFVNDNIIMVPPNVNRTHVNSALSRPSDYLADGTTVDEVFDGKFNELTKEFDDWELQLIGPGRYALTIDKNMFLTDQGVPIVLDLTGTPTWRGEGDIEEVDRIIP